MSQNIFCRNCGQIHPHKAHGLCGHCYNNQPHIKIHIVEFRARVDYHERRQVYDVKYALKQASGEYSQKKN